MIFLSLLLSLNSFAAAPCDDAGQIYRVCANQSEAFTAALAGAQEKKKNLVVEFGAQWCVWCHSLHTLFNEEAQEKNWAPKNELLEVGLYNGHDKSPTGEAVLSQIMAMAKVTKAPAGIPILAVINPATKKAVIIDTGPLEKNTETTKGHDPQKVWNAINGAAESLQAKK